MPVEGAVSRVEGLRHDHRLGLRLPVEVAGEDTSGCPFVEETRSLNISGGGILLVMSRPLPIGARLVLHVELPIMLRRHFGGRSTYHCRAAVCRVEPGNGSGQWRTGARFLGEVPGPA
jgi:hypothetical protein